MAVPDPDQSHSQDLRSLAGHIHTYESFARAIIADAVQSALDARSAREQKAYEFEWKVTVTAFRNCFCISMGPVLGEPGEPAKQHLFCRCHLES